MPDELRPSDDGAAGMATVTIGQSEGVTVITVSGEIDISNVDRVSDAVGTLPNTGPGLVVDLTAVSYIDSTAVSLFHDLAARLRQRAARLVVVSPSTSPPYRVLELTAMDATATVTDQVEAALAVVHARTGPPPAS